MNQKIGLSFPKVLAPSLLSTQQERLLTRTSVLTCLWVLMLVTSDVCRELEKKKVKFYKKQTDESFGKHAIIEDPDGHLISLVELSSREEFSQIPYYHGFAPV